MENYEYIANAFASMESRPNILAAAQLANLGAAGAEFVPVLFHMCRDTFQKLELQSRDHGFLLSGTRSIGAVINAVGFSDDDPIHADFLDWVIEFTHSDDLELRAIGVWALGDLGIPPEQTRTRLIELIQSERENYHEFVTVRSIAFRMLARLDRITASKFVSTEACKEYQQAVERWLQDYAEHGIRDGEGAREIEDEAAWLR